MLFRRIFIVSVLACLVLTVCGCTPSIVSSDAGVYSGNTLYAVASRDLTSVYEATLNALAELEIEVTEKAKDVFYAKVIAKGADGKMITIRIKPGIGNLTDFSIKVGPFGNKEKSSIIYGRIKQNLGISGK